MKPKKAAFIAAAGIGVIALLWAIWVWSVWMADREKDDFRKTCEVLNSEPFFEGNWLCIRDEEVVFP